MIAPQVPARGAIWHAIFNHQAHRQLDHPMGVVPPGRCHIAEIDGEAVLRRIAASLQTIQDPQQRLDRAFTLMEHESHERLPEVEKLPVHYYAEGIRSFETTLRLRQIVAFEHWRGNTACTLGEVIQNVSVGLS